MRQFAPRTTPGIYVDIFSQLLYRLAAWRALLGDTHMKLYFTPVVKYKIWILLAILSLGACKNHPVSIPVDEDTANSGETKQNSSDLSEATKRRRSQILADSKKLITLPNGKQISNLEFFRNRFARSDSEWQELKAFYFAGIQDISVIDLIRGADMAITEVEDYMDFGFTSRQSHNLIYHSVTIEEVVQKLKSQSLQEIANSYSSTHLGAYEKYGRLFSGRDIDELEAVGIPPEYVIAVKRDNPFLEIGNIIGFYLMGLQSSDLKNRFTDQKMIELYPPEKVSFENLPQNLDWNEVNTEKDVPLPKQWVLYSSVDGIPVFGEEVSQNLVNKGGIDALRARGDGWYDSVGNYGYSVEDEKEIFIVFEDVTKKLLGKRELENLSLKDLVYLTSMTTGYLIDYDSSVDRAITDEIMEKRKEVYSREDQDIFGTPRVLLNQNSLLRRLNERRGDCSAFSSISIAYFRYLKHRLPKKLRNVFPFGPYDLMNVRGQSHAWLTLFIFNENSLRILYVEPQALEGPLRNHSLHILDDPENIENFLWSMPEENFRVENFPDTAMEQRFSIVKKAYQFLYGTLLN